MGQAQLGPGTELSLDQGWGSAWTRHRAQPGPGMGLSLDQAQTHKFGALTVPIWDPFYLGPLQSPSWDPLHLGPIGVPFGDPFGGRRPTKWGSGGEAPQEFRAQ